LIGTAIATALLPTLSEHIAAEDQAAFKNTIERSLRVMIAFSFPVAVILSLGSLPLIQFAFGFSLEESQMILWATRGYLVGLLGHSAVELGVRSFYAKQNAQVPMVTSGLGLIIYIGFAVLFMRPLGAGGISLANSISYSVQGLLLFVLLSRGLTEKFQVGSTFLRSILSGVLGGICLWLIISVLHFSISPLILSIGGMILAAVVSAVPIWREIGSLTKL
jgi:putative peptidoglycan lipid II flippase